MNPSGSGDRLVGHFVVERSEDMIHWSPVGDCEIEQVDERHQRACWRIAMDDPTAFVRMRLVQE